MSETVRNDTELLASLESKLDLVRDRIRGVALGYTAGMVLLGEGGGGKTWNVVRTLEGLGTSFKLTNSRLSGRALYELLRDAPALTHIVDDCEPILVDKNALGVIRSCLWGVTGDDGKLRRVVTWHVAKAREEFLFRGGLILIGNAPPKDTPEIRAVMTRVPVVNFNPSEDELAAFMRHLAKSGHRHGQQSLSPAECLEVVEEVLLRSKRAGRKLDLRLYVNGCTDRLQWQAGAAENHWINLLESRLQQRVLHVTERYETQAERSAREMEIARRLAKLPAQERLAAWVKETGRSRAALYRRLSELSQ